MYVLHGEVRYIRIVYTGGGITLSYNSLEHCESEAIVNEGASRNIMILAFLTIISSRRGEFLYVLPGGELLGDFHSDPFLPSPGRFKILVSYS